MFHSHFIHFAQRCKEIITEFTRVGNLRSGSDDSRLRYLQFLTTGAAQNARWEPVSCFRIPASIGRVRAGNLI